MAKPRYLAWRADCWSRDRARSFWAKQTSIGCSRTAWHGRSACCPQAYSLFSGTVRENIARLAEGDIGEVILAAKLAGIHDVILRLPQGYDTVISEQEPLLSSGQRKGLAVARAFYGSPPVVILDEPLPHLDRRARSAVLKGIRGLQASGTIMLITTQTRSLSRIANKTLLLRSNRWELLESEAVAELRRRRRGKKADAVDETQSPSTTDGQDEALNDGNR